MSENVKNVDQNTFQKMVLESSIPVLVDFWAPWCGPCKAIGPSIDELSKEYDGKVGFVKLNVDEAPFIASKYSIMSIPTIIVFKNGQPDQHVIGMQPKNQLKKMVDKVLER